jgi:hypothetical protein
MKKKLYSLTEEHRAQLKPWTDKWIKNAMSTEPMSDGEKDICRQAVRESYAAAGKKEPRVIFVPSPFVARFSAGFAAAIWWLRKNPKSDISTNFTRAANAATHEAIRQATDDATSLATSQATNTAVYAATHDAIRLADSDLSKWYVIPGLSKIVSFGAALTGNIFPMKCAQQSWRFYQGGNQWSSWSAYLSFFRHIVKLELDWSKWDSWEQLSLHSGWRFVHEEFCIISDRPKTLLVDSENRPHCLTGPFCEWRDGTKLYSVHGVRVPAWIIKEKQSITPAKIDSEQNSEVRRVMMDLFGQERYIRESGVRATQEDDYGILYRKEISGDEALVMVKVVNSTPEPDGSFKDYWIRVPPGIKSAREAVAWSFNVPAESYVLEEQT